jgi:predicted metal-dependent hydrolase
MKAPRHCDRAALVSFAHEKRLWIHKKLAAKELLMSHRPAKEFVTGEGFSYLGRSHRLLLVDRCGPDVKLERGRLVIRRDVALSGAGAEAIIRWYRRRACNWLPPRVRTWGQRMGVMPRVIDVRDLGYRWGSLGKERRVNFHWATMQLSPSLVDYVIVHELAHIEEPLHNRTFWSRVETSLPSFERAKQELACVGSGLWLGEGQMHAARPK